MGWVGARRTLEGPPEKLAAGTHAVAAIAGCNPEISKPSQSRNSPEARNTWVSLDYYLIDYVLSIAQIILYARRYIYTYMYFVKYNNLSHNDLSNYILHVL